MPRFANNSDASITLILIDGFLMCKLTIFEGYSCGGDGGLANPDVTIERFYGRGNPEGRSGPKRNSKDIKL
jgi:hypothetical protein